jgi:hypothetical protein
VKGNTNNILLLTNDSVGLLILITLCLTSNYLTFLLSPKWISLELINILTTRRNTSPPNHNKYGVNTGLTSFGIPPLHPPEGNRRTHVRRSKHHTSNTQCQRYERLFLRRRWMKRSPRYHHDQRGVLRGRNQCVPTSQKPGTGGYNFVRDEGRTYSLNGMVTHHSDTHLPHVQQCGSSIQENDHGRIR